MKKISIFGKSTVEKTEKSYQIIKGLAYQLVKNNHICVHGGYAGGIMEAVSEGAQRAIDENGLCPNLNIGVPELRFDQKWARVPEAVFTEPATDIYSRLKMIMESELFIVAPSGGDGTLLEADIVIHENLINELLNKPIKPIIFIEGEDKKWTHLFNSRLENLDISKTSIDDYSWVAFVQYSELESYSAIMDRVMKKINQID